MSEDVNVPVETVLVDEVRELKYGKPVAVRKNNTQPVEMGPVSVRYIVVREFAPVTRRKTTTYIRSTTDLQTGEIVEVEVLTTANR